MVHSWVYLSEFNDVFELILWPSPVGPGLLGQHARGWEQGRGGSPAGYARNTPESDQNASFSSVPGSLIIVTSGLYVFARERRQQR